MRENLPLLASRGDDEVDAIISKAKDSTALIRVGTGIVCGLIPAILGKPTARYLFGEDFSRSQLYIAFVITALVCAFVAARLIDMILRQKIEGLASSL